MGLRRTVSLLVLPNVLTLTVSLLDACVFRPGGKPLGTKQCRICGAMWDEHEEHHAGCAYYALEKELR